MSNGDNRVEEQEKKVEQAVDRMIRYPSPNNRQKLMDEMARLDKMKPPSSATSDAPKKP